MRNTAFFVAGLVLVVIQQQLFRLTGLVPFAGFVPSLVLPLILFMGVHEYSLVRGASVAFVLGYATDLVGIAPVGLYTFSYVAVFLLSRAAGVRLAAQTMMMQMVLSIGFTAIHSAMVLVLVAIFGRDPWVPRALVKLVVPHVIATGLVAPLIFRLARRLHAATVASRLIQREGVLR